jgi:hypothetical protein
VALSAGFILFLRDNYRKNPGGGQAVDGIRPIAAIAERSRHAVGHRSHVGSLGGPPRRAARRPRIAAISTTYHVRSYSGSFITRFLARVLDQWPPLSAALRQRLPLHGLDKISTPLRDGEGGTTERRPALPKTLDKRAGYDLRISLRRGPPRQQPASRSGRLRFRRVGLGASVRAGSRRGTGDHSESQNLGARLAMPPQDRWCHANRREMLPAKSPDSRYDSLTRLSD